jgi:hypothetical protein
MRRCGLLVNFVELLDLVDVIGLGFKTKRGVVVGVRFGWRGRG